MRTPRALFAFEVLFICCGTLSVVYLGYVCEQVQFARHEVFAVEKLAASPSPSSASSRSDGILGQIEIAELGIIAPLTAGVEDIDLIRGVGHIPGTALPGGLGTIGVAGHRDTFFRSLRRIAPGMNINVTGQDGTYLYRTISTEIVAPSRIDVLETAAEPQLVLITCYPFHYLGAAPKRFVVHATLVSVEPLASSRSTRSEAK